GQLRGARPARAPAGRADTLGRLHRDRGAAGLALAGGGAPPPPAARRALRAVGVAARPRRGLRPLALPPRADGRAADRGQDRHRRLDRRRVPARHARQALLPGALGAPLPSIERMASLVRVDRQGAVAIVTINRPEVRNALSPP